MTKAKILILFLITFAVVTVVPFFTYASDTLLLEPSGLLNRIFSETSKNINTSLPSLSDIKLPTDFSKNTKTFLSNVDAAGGMGIDFSRFFNFGEFSSKNLTAAIKAVLVLAINLFLIVIQTVAAILKALLPLLQ